MVFDFLAALVQYGYLGAFAISLGGSATVFFPVPYYILIFGMAPLFNPVLLTLATGVGGGIGEMVTFFLARYGRKLFLKEKNKWILLTEKWFKRNGFLTILFVVATPLPADLAGMAAGALGYSKTKFFVAAVIGKIMQSAAVVYAGYYSVPWLVKLFGFG